MTIERTPVSVHWFRRDLRLTDNTALNAALGRGRPILCLFIFDTEILESLPTNDARVTFIHDSLTPIDSELNEYNSG